MKYLTDQFKLCFCFYIGNTKQLHLIVHGNTIGIFADNLLVATDDLSCLCMPVSNAVVE